MATAPLIRKFNSITKADGHNLNVIYRLLDRKTNTSIIYVITINPDKNPDVHECDYYFTEGGIIDGKLSHLCRNKKVSFNNCERCQSCKYLAIQDYIITDHIINDPRADCIKDKEAATVRDIIDIEISQTETKECYAKTKECPGCTHLRTHCNRCIVIPSIPGSDFCGDCNDNHCLMCYHNPPDSKCFCSRPDDDTWPICNECRSEEHPICTEYVYKCSLCNKKTIFQSKKKDDCKSCKVTSSNMLCYEDLVFSCLAFRQNSVATCPNCYILYDKKTHPPDCPECLKYKKIYHLDESKYNHIIRQIISSPSWNAVFTTPDPLELILNFQK